MKKRENGEKANGGEEERALVFRKVFHVKSRVLLSSHTLNDHEWNQLFME